LRFRDAANLNSFDPAAAAAEDSNSRLGRFQKLRQIFAECGIRAIFQRWSLQAHFKRTFDHTADFVAAGAGLNADRKNHAFGRLAYFEQGPADLPPTLILNGRFNLGA
jgi:hypothetical protein